MTDIYDIEDELEELEEYLDCDNNDEFAEPIRLLMLLTNYYDYISEDLYSMVVSELLSILDYYKNNTKIVTKEVTNTIMVKELIIK